MDIIKLLWSGIGIEVFALIVLGLLAHIGHEYTKLGRGVIFLMIINGLLLVEAYIWL